MIPDISVTSCPVLEETDLQASIQMGPLLVLLSIAASKT